MITQIGLYLLVSLGINLFLFIPAFIFRTDKLTDLSYSISFATLITMAYLFSSNKTINGVILLSMVLLWAFRLGAFLFIRIQFTKKDKRFDGIRENVLSFFKFWVLQGVAVWIVLLPALMYLSNTNSDIFLIGAIIWIVGFIIESLADSQKFKFKKQKRNEKKFIQRGLWKYSRHPNYFGEMLCWIGIYLLVFPSLTTPQAIIGVISPLSIITLLVFVTGLPPLERKAEDIWGKTNTYREYKQKTNILIPWFPKK